MDLEVLVISSSLFVIENVADVAVTQISKTNSCHVFVADIGYYWERLRSKGLGWLASYLSQEFHCGSVNKSNSTCRLVNLQQWTATITNNGSQVVNCVPLIVVVRARFD